MDVIWCGILSGKNTEFWELGVEAGLALLTITPGYLLGEFLFLSFHV